jgi:segregation and condensation protein A
MLDTAIQVKTDYFDGPLALLLMLVKKEDMSIRELDLNKVTKQYLAYLSQMKDLNFDVAGDYLYFAATLLLLKSKHCLDFEDQKLLESEFGENTHLNMAAESQLIYRLEQLELYQRMGKKLWALPKLGHQEFVRPKVKRSEVVNSILLPMDLQKLTEAMLDFLKKEKRKFTVVRRDRLSIKEKLKFLKDYLSLNESYQLDKVILEEGGNNIDNIIITFISFLELARLKMCSIFQNEENGSIYIKITKSLDSLDVDQANGFDDEDEEESEESDEDESISEDLSENVNSGSPEGIGGADSEEGLLH